MDSKAQEEHCLYRDVFIKTIAMLVEGKAKDIIISQDPDTEYNNNLEEQSA